MTMIEHHAIGADRERLDALAKVTGKARYAVEHPVRDVVHGWVVGATVPAGRVTGVDVASATSVPGVLDVLWHGNAPRLADPDDAELRLLQDDQVSYYGQVVAVVVAETLEAARAGALALAIDYDPASHRSWLDPEDPELVAPDALNAGFATSSSRGDAEQALDEAPHTVDAVYTTPPLHNQPMEPHGAIAAWQADGSLTLWDTTQNATEVARTTAALFGLEPGQSVVHSEYVGGGFGAKGTTRPHAVLAAMAARVVGRPVKLALTRDMTFHLVGHRTPTRQRVRLGADAEGRLTAIAHDVIEHTSQLLDFAEQTGECSRHMYAAPNALVTHRLARLNVPTPRWMRAPGEAPGMFALESAIDELAREAGIDPIELRVRNEPATDPESGKEFSSRHYIECLREGAARFGWGEPYDRRSGTWYVGHGVAGAVYPAITQPSTARATVNGDGSYEVALAAADIGTGARTALQQIAADALGVPPEVVAVRVGDSSLPRASVAGGSSGTASWGSAITKACRSLRSELGRADHVPAGGPVGHGGDRRRPVAAGGPGSVRLRGTVRGGARPRGDR